MKHSRKAFLAFAVSLLLFASCASGGKQNGATENTPSEETVGTTLETSLSEDDGDSFVPNGYESKITGELDADADSVEGIAIKNAEDLSKIGNDAAYPMNGDYVLVADIDLTGSLFTPIGGAESDSGVVKGGNVFSGTFDGRGHTIVGLTIDLSPTRRSHIGLFGSVGSSVKKKPAEIRNLILKDVSVTCKANATIACAALAGQVNGYAVLDNISLLSGKVEVDNLNGDVLGIGSLIGQCRTAETAECSNEDVQVSNIFANLTIIGDNNGYANYTSGLIGRIRGSNLGKLSNVLQLGSVTHEGVLAAGNAITTGDSGVKVSKNVYYLEGVGRDYGYGVAKTQAELTAGSLLLDKGSWTVKQGVFPMPNSAAESPLYSVLDFIMLTPAKGEDIQAVESNFALPESVMGVPIQWTSDNDGVVRAEDGQAKITQPESGYAEATLFASADGFTKAFPLRVFSGVEGEIVLDGENVLRAVHYPEGSRYRWTVVNMATGGSTQSMTNNTGTFELTSTMDNVKVTVSVEGYPSATYYHSAIPTVVISSTTDYYSLDRNRYSNAKLKIYTTAKYANTSYNGATEIRLRGNSTAYAYKRPFKLKLDKKTDLFGMGKSKHWVLLANVYDWSNMRNKLSYDLSMSLGMVGCDSIFVNLIYNDQYYGLYQLSENVRIDPGRVDIYDWEDTAKAVAKSIALFEGLSEEEKEALEDRLTTNLAWVTSGQSGQYKISDYYDTSTFNTNGGYLLENDFYYDEVSRFTTQNDMKLMVKSPEYLSTNKVMFEELQTYIQDMENAIYSPNRLNSAGRHYTEYMDLTSFLDFWMVNQLFKNVELLFKSCYMYKDVDQPLVFGPVWDMDWTSGNHVNLWGLSGAYDSWKHSESQDREYWYRALYNDPNFIVQLYDRWNEIQDKIDDMMARIDVLDGEIRKQAELDNQTWWYGSSYQDEVKALRSWLENRRAWMKEQFATPDSLIRSLGYYKESSGLQISSLEESGDAVTLTVSVTDERFKSADLLVNGKVYDSYELTDGMTISVPKSDLREAGTYNAVELLAKASDGSYVIMQNRGGERGSAMAQADYCFFQLTK